MLLRHLFRRRPRPPAPVAVDVVTRAASADDAELRLFLTVRLQTEMLSAADLQRVAFDIVAPAAAAEVGRHALADLGDALPAAVSALPSVVGATVAGQGAELIEVSLVAAEHLLVPAAGIGAGTDRAHGPD